MQFFDISNWSWFIFLKNVQEPIYCLYLFLNSIETHLLWSLESSWEFTFLNAE